MIEILNSWDTMLFLFLNSIHSGWSDPVMEIVSGKFTWIPLYVLTLVYVFVKRKYHGFMVVVFIVLAIIIADRASVELFKNVFERLRPSHNPELKEIVHLVNGYRGGLFGFVSSHAANTFGFAAVTSCFFKNRWYSWLIFSWAAFVSYSRVYLGVHYPGDILGGALLGIVAGYISFYLFTLADKKWFNTSRKGI